MRRMRLLPVSSFVAGLLLLGCGPAKPTVDAGPDTTCGLDCVAQENYGLIVNRCFEYSADRRTKQPTPSLGVWVREVFELEGGVKTIPVEYRQGGQTMQTDYFSIKNGDLMLMRRSVNRSVTYRTDTAITGVKWLSQGTAAGENFSTKTTAFLSIDDSSTATTYKVDTLVPGADEILTPLATYDLGIKVIFSETPTDHGSDPRRVFMPGLGFTLIATPFNLLGNSNTVPHYLQRVRDIGTADAGPEACSLGNP